MRAQLDSVSKALSTVVVAATHGDRSSPADALISGCGSGRQYRSAWPNRRAAGRGSDERAATGWIARPSSAKVFFLYSPRAAAVGRAARNRTHWDRLAWRWRE